jgi:tetratricopeptide (TPR) repeat protein
MRQDEAAKKIVDGLPAVAAKLDPQAITGAASGGAGVFALAAIPARWALERRSWSEAAALVPRTTTIPYTEAMTHLVRALGAAHTRDLPRARASIDSLAAIRDRLSASGESYWAEQVAIEWLEDRAALAMAEGRHDDAIADMREAVTREDATEKNAITPGSIVPAHELFGDVLMELGKPADALAEYRKSLVKEPNRFRSLVGAKKAADATGDKKAGADYAAQVEKLTGSKAFTQR